MFAQQQHVVHTLTSNNRICGELQLPHGVHRESAHLHTYVYTYVHVWGEGVMCVCKCVCVCMCVDVCVYAYMCA